MKTESYTVSEYICEKCNTHYDSPANAEKCEKMDLPEEPSLNIGDEITYDEENNLGSHWSYSGFKRQILDKKMVGGRERHVYVYLVNNWGTRRWVLPDTNGNFTSPVEAIE